MKQLRLKIITCEILQREIQEVLSSSNHNIETSVIEMKRCHERIKEGHVIIQEAIDAEVGQSWDALLMGWALCGRMLNGIVARDIPLVIPRAHDCLTILFGSRQRYSDYFLNNTGTYYLSNGWINHARDDGGELASQTQMGELSADYESLVEEYGEENAAYLSQILGGWESHYHRCCLILQDHDKKEELKKQALDLIQSRGWELTTEPGDLGLLRRWVSGEWDDQEFLVVPPEHEVTESYDDLILGARKPAG